MDCCGIELWGQYSEVTNTTENRGGRTATSLLTI
jgi:hypothetical protein